MAGFLKVAADPIGNDGLFLTELPQICSGPTRGPGYPASHRSWGKRGEADVGGFLALARLIHRSARVDPEGKRSCAVAYFAIKPRA